MYNLLYVDDEPIERQAFKIMVERELYDDILVHEAGCGSEALALCRQVSPDIIVMDIHMPGKNGLETLKEIKGILPNIKSLILSSHNTFDYAKEALLLNVENFIVKPAKIKELTKEILSVVSKIESESFYTKAEQSASVVLLDETLKNAKGHLIVKKALEYIDEHYASNIVLEDVADHVYVSSFHLSKLLKTHAGKNYTDIILELRLSKAKMLLENDSLNIKEVSYMSGFNSQTYFSKVFKNYAGITPGEYKINKNRR